MNLFKIVRNGVTVKDGYRYKKEAKVNRDILNENAEGHLIARDVDHWKGAT